MHRVDMAQVSESGDSEVFSLHKHLSFVFLRHVDAVHRKFVGGGCFGSRGSYDFSKGRVGLFRFQGVGRSAVVELRPCLRRKSWSKCSPWHQGRWSSRSPTACSIWTQRRASSQLSRSRGVWTA